MVYMYLRFLLSLFALLNVSFALAQHETVSPKVAFHNGECIIGKYSDAFVVKVVLD